MPSRNQFKTNEEYNLYFCQYRAKNKEKMRSYQREYNREYRKKNGFKNEIKWKKNNPLKVRIENILQYAVRYGRIKRQPCEVCGKKKTHGHHKDYNKPLKAIWLCPLHHKEIHKKLKVIYGKTINSF